MGEVRRAGRSTGPTATWELSVGRLREHGVIQQRTHTLNPPPYQHCICNQLRFAKLYTCPNLSARLRLFIVCSAITATACDEPGMTAVCWVWQDTGDYMRETGALCNLTPLQLPVRCSTSQGPPPNHSCVVWYLLCCSIHALSA